MDNKNIKITALAVLMIYLVLRITAFFAPFIFRNLHALFKVLPLAAIVLFILSLRNNKKESDHPDAG